MSVSWALLQSLLVLLFRCVSFPVCVTRHPAGEQPFISSHPNIQRPEGATHSVCVSSYQKFEDTFSLSACNSISQNAIRTSPFYQLQMFKPPFGLKGFEYEFHSPPSYEIIIQWDHHTTKPGRHNRSAYSVMSGSRCLASIALSDDGGGWERAHPQRVRPVMLSWHHWGSNIS